MKCESKAERPYRLYVILVIKAIVLIGWTYESSRTKMKDAQKQLEEFLLQDSIDDLNAARDAELKVLDERINNWDEYLRMLEQKYKEYERLNEQKLLRELLNIETQEQLEAILNGDMEAFASYSFDNKDMFLEDMIGAYMGFDTTFGTFLDDYKENLEMLEYYNKQSLNMLNAENYQKANGKFIESYIEEQLGEIIPLVTSRGYSGPEIVLFLPVSTYGDIGDADIKTRGKYNYDTSVTNTEGVKSVQNYLKGLGIDNVIVDGKYGDQTMSAIYEVFDRGTSSQKAELRSKLAAAGITYDENSNTLYTNGFIANYDQLNKNYSGTTRYGTIDTASGRSTGYDNGSVTNVSDILDSLGVKSDGKWGHETAVAAGRDLGYTDGREVSADDYVKLKGGVSAANGILAGPVTYTGLAMLHGTPSSPEYVLNSDQAYSLLRYMATNKPNVTTTQTSNDTVYQFNGGITMNGVNDAEEFFNELTRAMSNRFNVTKNRY